MSNLKIKSGVIVPRVVIIAAAVINAANEMGIETDMVITSGRDGKHRENSLHYYDRALDFRTKHLDSNVCNLLIRTIRRRLGKSYDVILESYGKPNEHLHIEYDPKN